MKRFLKWIKGLFSDKHLKMNSLSGTYVDYDSISASAFVHEKLLKRIYQDIIILIVNNGFAIDPAIFIDHFKRHYDFSVNEFVVLSFKIGSMTKFYLEHPSLLLEDAIKLEDTFSKENIENFRRALKQQRDHDERIFSHKADVHQEKIEEDKRKAKIGAKEIENAEADAKIDEWLEKNKKS